MCPLTGTRLLRADRCSQASGVRARTRVNKGEDAAVSGLNEDDAAGTTPERAAQPSGGQRTKPIEPEGLTRGKGFLPYNPTREGAKISDASLGDAARADAAVVEHIIANQMQQPHQDREQHPFSYIFVGRRTYYLLSSIKDILRLRATCTWLRGLLGAAQLRDRLRHSLGSQEGLRRAVNGQQVQLLRFDDDQFGVHDLLAAVCVMEEGEWVEMGEVIELAAQCGNCELPVILTADDINTHANKTAYVSAPRVLAQLKMVGRHVRFSDDSCLQLFQHGNDWRAITDEPGFRVEVDPPLPAGHLYQQYRQPHDPPVRERIYYSPANARWMSTGGPGYTEASVSSFAKFMVLDHFNKTHQINDQSIILNRYVGGGRLDGLLTESPHTPVAGCTTTLGWGVDVRFLVLTGSNHSFAAWIDIRRSGNNNVGVRVRTTEAAVCGSGPFKHRFPVTTQLARVALRAVAPYAFDGQV
ncbi:unnamed protein product [Vitrella brassicaformis CCMP3155]|uniref:Uncharacterized protein n=1 Tax=Vitrella brassicaformis (strain CCMP3155) TaxID=1169540 RepID=A0A0G4EZW9_VITBC|nr:unnamed protein product [Vitrella brassicaformis CCMP3155]|eukprot:CEM04596.1 unnamed protein product [Vitrella brassicaformis CCMP3155]